MNLQHSIKPTLLLWLLFCSVGAEAQEHGPDNSSTIPNVFNLPRQFIFIDITQTNWLSAPEGVEIKYISGGWNLNFFYEFYTAGSRLGIAPGISYANTGVKSNSFYEYTYDNQGNVTYTGLAVLDDSVYTKSKLSTTYLEIPLELHIHSNPSGARSKSFLIGPGFRAGWLVGDFWKLRLQNLSPDKVKIYNIENLSKFRYGVSLRLVYYKFGLFGYYQLNHLFEKDKGPAINPISFGITISPL